MAIILYLVINGVDLQMGHSNIIIIIVSGLCL